MLKKEKRNEMRKKMNSLKRIFTQMQAISELFSFTHSIFFLCCAPLVARENSISNVSFSYHFSPILSYLPHHHHTHYVKTSVDVSREILFCLFFLHFVEFSDDVFALRIS